MSQQPNRQHQPSYENRSRLGLATPAIRPGMKARLLLAGPSGSGKTFSSLLIAMALREHTDRASVVMIDTEKDSGRTYADEFVLADGSPAYMHVPWAAPYDAVDLAMTLRDVSGQYDVVVIDSHSHFWGGQGGVLDVAGGRWTGWKEARPMHADMIDAILSCDAHVILCARMAQENVQEEVNGKKVVRKLGMKIKQDSELEYEVNIALELDMQHVLRVTKSRTRAVPVGKEYLAGHAEEFAGQYREWLAGGEPAATKEQQDALVEALNRIEDPPARMQAKQDFIAAFGQPTLLLQSRLPEANEWIADRLLGGVEAPERAPDEVPEEHADEEPERPPLEVVRADAEDGPSEAPEAAVTGKDVPSAPGRPTETVELPLIDGDAPAEHPEEGLVGFPPPNEWVNALDDVMVLVELAAFRVEVPRTKSARRNALTATYAERVIHEECGKVATGPRRDGEPFCECPV